MESRKIKPNCLRRAARNRDLVTGIQVEPVQYASASHGPLEALHIVLLGFQDGKGQEAEFPGQFTLFSQGPRAVAHRVVL